MHAVSFAHVIINVSHFALVGHGSCYLIGALNSDAGCQALKNKKRWNRDNSNENKCGENKVNSYYLFVHSVCGRITTQ